MIKDIQCVASSFFLKESLNENSPGRWCFCEGDDGFGDDGFGGVDAGEDSVDEGAATSQAAQDEEDANNAAAEAAGWAAFAGARSPAEAAAEELV